MKWQLSGTLIKSEQRVDWKTSHTHTDTLTRHTIATLVIAKHFLLYALDTSTEVPRP